MKVSPFLFLFSEDLTPLEVPSPSSSAEHDDDEDDEEDVFAELPDGSAKKPAEYIYCFAKNSRKKNAYK